MARRAAEVQELDPKARVPKARTEEIRGDNATKLTIEDESFTMLAMVPLGFCLGTKGFYPKVYLL